MATDDETRRRLLERKLGRWLDWKKPAIIKTVGPYAPEIFDRFDARRLEIVDSCSVWLESLDPDQLALLSDRKLPDEADIREQWIALKRIEIDHLDRQQPHWHAGGLGHPDYSADCVYWSKMHYFTVHELTCLSVGIGPDKLIPELMPLLEKTPSESWSQSLSFLLDRRELIERRFPTRLNGDHIRPMEFLDWASQIELEVHHEFRTLLARLYAPAETKGPRSLVTDPRVTDSLTKLLTAMAIDAYGYDPSSLRSPIPRRLSDIALRFGLTISDDTIRTHLRAGARMMAKDDSRR